MSKEYVLLGAKLGVEDLWSVAVEKRKVGLSEEAIRALEKGRKFVDGLLLESEAKPIYGINTGFGSLKDRRIEKKDLEALQRNLIRSHSVGVGNAYSKEVVRGMMLLRAQNLSKGYSGVRKEIVQLLCELLNRDLIPVIPEQGSVGASGDLAPLSHLALTLMGEGEFWTHHGRVASSKVFSQAGLTPIVPQAKEGLALINGTQAMTAQGALAWRKATQALKNADLAVAMTLEATQGSIKAFDERVHRLRPHPGQAEVAKNVRALLEESEILVSHENCDRVQDAYSIRCAPQVHGAARDCLRYVGAVLSTEMDSVTDNPLLFPDDEESLSAGNFHGQPVAVAMDCMALALTSVGSMSDRRSFRMLSPQLSGLPAGLIENAGLQSGMMMAQVTTASLVNETKVLSHPSSVDSISTWADQEDHVSMGTFGARKAFQIVEMLEQILAIEILLSSQALEFQKELRPGRGVALALKAFREEIFPLSEDRVLAQDMKAALSMIREGRLLQVLSENGIDLV